MATLGKKLKHYERKKLTQTALAGSELTKVCLVKLKMEKLHLL